jgi:hypothetical protein
MLRRTHVRATCFGVDMPALVVVHFGPYALYMLRVCTDLWDSFVRGEDASVGHCRIRA